MRSPLLILLIVALAAAGLTGAQLLIGGGGFALASGESCTAVMAGLETSRKTPVELVVFNDTGVELSLNLTVRDTSGDPVLERPGAIIVGPSQTAVVSLEAELARDLAKKEKPFAGIVAVELRGDAPFSGETAIVHATQYFGKRKKPRGAVIFRPLFRSDDS